MVEYRTSSFQEIFSHVYAALLKQGVASYGEMTNCMTTSEMCLYRGPNGTKCALGHLIPDEEYRLSMEGQSISDLDFGEDPYFNMNDDRLGFLASLQGVHDRYMPRKDAPDADRSIDKWKREMGNLARDFKLEVPSHES
jgi:hypothetical protein